jgi:long-chain acyl-CoA synthetase
MTNLSLYLAESANEYPDARAVVSDDTTTSYSALANDVARFADYLIDGGLRAGDRVGVMLPNGPEFAVVFYGVLHAGGVVVPLSPPLHARALDFYLTTTGARMLFITPQHALANTAAAVTAGVQPVEIRRHGIARLTAGFPGRTDPATRTPGDAAVVLTIAETTGAHTVALTHGELANSQAMTAARLLPLGDDEVVMGCLPMDERSGLTCGLLPVISTGSTLVLPRSDPAFDPASALELIAAERVTVFEGVAPMYEALVEAANHDDGDFSSLRIGVSTGGSLPEGILRTFEERFGCVIVDAGDLSVAGPLRIARA